MVKYAHMKYLIYCLLFFILSSGNCILFASPVKAVVDPLSVPNNKFGIHIISPTESETSPAAVLVNSSGGDWGYITVLIESNNRDHDKWQTFFNDLRRKHLIPVVRLATQPEKDYWKRPYEGEEEAWADFLNNLNWPTKNRYVTIYNEPNYGKEWAGKVDPKVYAHVLDKTITALKARSEDFFVLNGGFDASAPPKPPLYLDEISFLQQMEGEVPGIFNKLDGWVSHSYPNPGFIGSPDDVGKGTIRTWFWETQILKGLGVTKNLPVFITETGWKHAEGINFDKSLPSSDTIADYYKSAFATAWNSEQIVAVTPFLLNYQEPPFDHFSFKKISGEGQETKILGVETNNKTDQAYPGYYPYYEELVKMEKITGNPKQDNKANLIKGDIYSSLVSGENYNISLTFKNTGQSIWNDKTSVELRAIKGAQELQVEPVKLAPNQQVEPGQTAVFNLKLKAPRDGLYTLSLQLYNGNQAFDQNPLNFTTAIKSPVSLMIQSALKWKKDFSGDYILTVSSNGISNSLSVELNKNGQSGNTEAKYLLPDYTFDFTLHKQFYQPKTIKVRVNSGENILDFGELEPDVFSAFFKPGDLWKLLPFSN